MRYLKLFESFNKKDIRSICKEYNIKKYKINSDGSIDVNSSVNFWCKGLSKIPIKFNKINYDFSCSNNELTSLEGSPVEVNGGFYCNNNKLISLQYAPKIIRDNFFCQDNNINSFEYFPSFIKDYFFCYNNPIYQVWKLFEDTAKIELLNDFDIFRDEDTNTPVIVMDRLNDFLLTIGKKEVKKVDGYKNI